MGLLENFVRRRSKSDGSLRVDPKALMAYRDKLREIDQHYNQLEAFVSQCPASVAMWDTGMRLLACSNLWSQQFGPYKKEWVERGLTHYQIHDLLGTPIPEKWREHHRRVIQDGEVITSEIDDWRQPDGSLRFVQYICQPWRKGSGEIGGMIAGGADITEIHAKDDLIAELQKRIVELEEDVKRPPTNSSRAT